MKTMKRCISFLLALVMVLGMMPQITFRASAASQDVTTMPSFTQYFGDYYVTLYGGICAKHPEANITIESMNTTFTPITIMENGRVKDYTTEVRVDYTSFCDKCNGVISDYDMFQLSDTGNKYTHTYVCHLWKYDRIWARGLRYRFEVNSKLVYNDIYISNWGKSMEHHAGIYTFNDRAQHEVSCTFCHTFLRTEECSGGEATCASGAACKYCKGVYMPPIPYNHNWGEWKSNGVGGHYRICKDNSAHVEEELCTYSNASNAEQHYEICEICGYITNEEDHYGGTATCVEGAACDVCSVVYTGKSSEHLKIEWYRNNVTHVQKCTACNSREEFNYGSHTYTGEWYMGSYSDYMGIHYGHYRICECGYKSKVEDHTYAYEKDPENPNRHVRYCTVCNTTSTQACSGGKATCVKGAVCSGCGQEYGSIDPDKHSGGTATCSQLAVCDACGKGYGNLKPSNHASEDTYYQLVDENSHSLHYACCHEQIVTEAHTTASVATCTAQEYCSVCQATYGETNGENHTGELVWSVDRLRHVKKWTCCDATESTLEYHIPKFAVSEDGLILSATCETCEMDLGSMTFDLPEYDFVYDGQVHDVGTSGVIECAFGENTPRITYWQDGKQVGNGICSAGTYTIRLSPWNNFDNCAQMEVTIQKRELTVAGVYVYDRVYNGTNVVDAHSIKYDNLAEGEEVFSSIEGTVVVSGSDAGTYKTVKGLESVTPFTSYIESYHGDNYYVNVDPETEYPVVGTWDEDYMTIYPYTFWIEAHDQDVTVDEELDQTAYTIVNPLEGYEVSGVVLEMNEWNSTVDVNTDKAVVTHNGEKVTRNFDFGSTSGVLLVTCEGHKFNEDGFCATGECDSYLPAKQIVGENEWGSEETWYEVHTPGQLYWVAERVNTYGDNYINIRLMKDITVNEDLSAENLREWVPIGMSYPAYCGEFDGRSHTISGLYVNDPDQRYVGLFGYTDYNYQIRNVHLTNSYFEGASYVGGLFGYCGSLVSGCSVDESVTVKGETNVGGFAGYLTGSVTNCWSAAGCELKDGQNYYCGGFIGRVAGSVENCFTTQDSLAGDIYWNGGEVKKSYYLSEAETEDGGRTAQQFASGEVAYLLQGGIRGEEIYDEETDEYITMDPAHVWGQNIGTDAHPTLGGAVVYYGYISCNADDAMVYTNDEKASDEVLPHSGEPVLTSNHDGTHNMAYSCCDTAAGERKACTIDEVTGQCVCGTVFYYAERLVRDSDDAEFSEHAWFADVQDAIAYASSLEDEDTQVAEATLKFFCDWTIGEEGVDFPRYVSLDANGHTITAEGSVTVNGKAALIFENQLYLDAGDLDNSYISTGRHTNPTYWTAGSGYVIFDGCEILEFHDAEAILSGISYASHPASIVARHDLTIYFYGSNTLTKNYSSSSKYEGLLLEAEGDLTLVGMGEDAALYLSAGVDGRCSDAVRCHNLVVKSGTVYAAGRNGSSTSNGINTANKNSVGTVVVESGAVLNVFAEDAAAGSAGIYAQEIIVDGTLNANAFGTVSPENEGSAGILFIGSTKVSGTGTINAFALAVDVANLRIEYTAYGDAVIPADLTALCGEPFVTAFTVPEGTSLTVADGVTVDISMLNTADIDFSGTVINDGTIILPAGSRFSKNITGGVVTVGQHTYTWDGENGKWICTDGGHDVEDGYCTICGERIPIVITAHPGDYVGVVGETAVFTVTAQGEGLTYQWYYYNAAQGEWLKSYSPGCNTDTLSVAVYAYRDGQQYRCVITDAYGNSVTSQTAAITLDVDGMGIAATSGDVVGGAIGKTYTFSVDATGDNLTYLWQVSTDGGETWAQTWLSGYNTDTLTVKFNANRAGNLYRCIVSCGKTSVTSEPMGLYLQEASVEIQGISGNVKASIGETATFIVTAAGKDLSYAWYRSYDNGATWEMTYLPGYNTDTLSFEVDANRTGLFLCKVTDGSGKTVCSDWVRLTLSAQIVTMPESVDCAIGDTATFTVAATGENLRYQWYYSADGGETWVMSYLTGYNTETLSFYVNASRSSRIYKCVITDRDGATLETDAVSVNLG